MQFKRNFSFLFTDCVHPRKHKHLPSLASSQRKIRQILDFLLPTCLSPHFLSSIFCNMSSTTPQTQRKISSITKLFSTELPTLRSPVSFLSSLFPKFSPFSKTDILIISSRLPWVTSRSFSNSPVPPLSIIASPTSIIIRSRHSSSILIQRSRHANFAVQHLTPNPAKLPMQKWWKSSRHATNGSITKQPNFPDQWHPKIDVT